MSFREKKNKEALVFQSTGLGVILGEPSFWKALILELLVYLCLSGERVMPFLSLCVCFTAVPNTPYTFLLLALPTLPWRLSFSLWIDRSGCLHISAKFFSFPIVPQPPPAKFIFFSMVHKFPFPCMGNNFSDCGFAPTNPLISSFSPSFQFYAQGKAMAFVYMKHPNCPPTYDVLSVSLWGKHVCSAFTAYVLIKKKSLTLRRAMKSPFGQRMNLNWHFERSEAYTETGL